MQIPGEEKKAPCENCGGWYKNELYVLKSGRILTLCLDCWVIDYDRGKIDDE